MDDFPLDRPELTGSQITLEFGSNGRIQQLWVSDPLHSQDNEEFQFVCPPVGMSEESSDEYLPGTILVGARTHPDDPWMVSRSASAEPAEEDEEGSEVSFNYTFNFLDELEATGKFYEIAGPTPQIAWDVEIKNKSRRSLEIGELAFPLALNDIYEGFERSDEAMREMFADRLHAHLFIGGSASHLLAQRMNGRGPGLIIYPGEDTRWEFFNRVPASLTTPYRWGGVPVVYAHSRAAIEREGWAEWMGSPSSIVLEPRETRTYRMRFAATPGHVSDPGSAVLKSVGRPVARLFPAAVAPFGVGIGVEISGATPATFTTDAEAETETDADDEGGFCFVRPASAGPLKLTFVDTQERTSEVNLLFTEPIENLISARAKWILENQIIGPGGFFEEAIAPAILDDKQKVLVDEGSFSNPFGIESSLADALFLAEKNSFFPVQSELDALDRYLGSFLEQKVVNLANGSVGAILTGAPPGVAHHTGRANLYPMVACLYDALANAWGLRQPTGERANALRANAVKVMVGLFEQCDLTETHGIGLMSIIHEAFMGGEYDDVEGIDEVRQLTRIRVFQIAAKRYPFAGESIYSPVGFEESLYAARLTGNPDQIARTTRCALAARSFAPTWWSFGQDRRWSEEPSAPPHPATVDKGELCLSPSTVATSVQLMRAFDRDTASPDESLLRASYGGLLGVWAMVRPDGAASMGFCPDVASKQFGVNWTTGDIGLGLFLYLRGAASYVLTSRQSGTQVLGCHFEAEVENGTESFVVRPWDGVAKRVAVRHLGLEFKSFGARMLEIRFDAFKRWATLTLENPSDQPVEAAIVISGLWGNRFEANGDEIELTNRALVVPIMIQAAQTASLSIRVKQ